MHFIFFVIGLIGFFIPGIPESYHYGFLGVAIIANIKFLLAVKASEDKKRAKKLKEEDVLQSEPISGNCIFYDYDLTDNYPGYYRLYVIKENGKEKTLYTDDMELMKVVERREGSDLLFYHYKNIAIKVEPKN